MKEGRFKDTPTHHTKTHQYQRETWRNPNIGAFPKLIAPTKTQTLIDKNYAFSDFVTLCNLFSQKKLELGKVTIEELKELLGRARAKKGMFEGDLIEGELEIGQIAGLIHAIKPAGKIIEETIAEFEMAKKEVLHFN